MYFAKALFAVAAIAGVFAQTPDPQINTPSGVVECLPIQLTFSGSAPPFVITIEAFTGTGYSTDLTTVGTTSSTSITWTANLPPNGSGYIAVIRDGQGRLGASGAFQVAAGSSTCLTATASSVVATTPAGSSSVAGSTTPTSAGSVPTSAAVVTNVGGSSITTHIPTTAPSSAAAATSTTSKSGAQSVSPIGVAGLVGVVGVVAALL